MLPKAVIPSGALKGGVEGPAVPSRHTQIAPRPRRQREGGYFLLAVMLMMAFIVITATYVVLPRIVQQIKRDREEEMIHRGTEYARAIRKFYKKNGRYPSSLDDLDKGQIRFLRKRFKDPLTKDGKWKMLQYGDIQTLLNGATPGNPAAGLNQSGFNPGGSGPGLAGAATINSGGGSSFGQSFGGGSLGGGSFGGGSFGSQQPLPNQQFQQNSGQNPGTVVGSPTGSDQSGTGGFNNSAGGNNQSGFGSSQTGNGSPFGQSSGSGQTFGGGAVVGVASVSKDPTIRIYNKKKKYDEWQFIYNPIMDQNNVLLRGPYQPTTIGSKGIGTPASQLGQQQNGNQQNGFGQPSNGLGQGNNGSGQQPGYGQQQNPPQQPGNNNQQ